MPDLIPMKRNGWQRDRPDNRDLPYKSIQPRSFLFKRVAQKREVDLRDTGFLPVVWDQGNLGSCVVQSWAALIHYVLQREAKAQFMPSRLAHYYDIRLAYGKEAEDTGCQIRDGGRSLKRTGIGSEELWAYDPARFAEYPSMKCLHEGYHRRLGLVYARIEKLSDILDCLSEGWPVAFGMALYESFDEASITGVVPMPRYGERVTGGHAMTLVGYSRPERRALMRNSWGPYWNPGMRGHAWIPFDLIEQEGCDFWTLRKMNI